MDLRLLIEAILCDGNVERFLRTDTIDGMWTDLTRPERAERAGAVWNRACETNTHTHCTHARIGRERENTAFAHLIFWMRIHDSNRLRIWIGSRQLLDGSSLVSNVAYLIRGGSRTKYTDSFTERNHLMQPVKTTTLDLGYCT